MKHPLQHDVDVVHRIAARVWQADFVVLMHELNNDIDIVLCGSVLHWFPTNSLSLHDGDCVARYRVVYCLHLGVWEPWVFAKAYFLCPS